MAKRAVAEQKIEYTTEYEEEYIQIRGENMGSWPPKSVKVQYDCQCVGYAKKVTGYSDSIGNARNWPKNSKVPVVGGVVVTKESNYGHVGVIEQVLDSSIIITEKNYKPCQITTRKLKLDDPVIIGFWSPYTE